MVNKLLFCQSSARAQGSAGGRTLRSSARQNALDILARENVERVVDRADFLVIGGGLAGASAAYELSAASTVILLGGGDRHRLPFDGPVPPR